MGLQDRKAKSVDRLSSSMMHACCKERFLVTQIEPFSDLASQAEVSEAAVALTRHVTSIPGPVIATYSRSWVFVVAGAGAGVGVDAGAGGEACAGVGAVAGAAGAGGSDGAGSAGAVVVAVGPAGDVAVGAAAAAQVSQHRPRPLGREHLRPYTSSPYSPSCA